MVALALNWRNNEFYGVEHGRDMLFENWLQFFTVDEGAVLPAEESSCASPAGSTMAGHTVSSTR